MESKGRSVPQPQTNTGGNDCSKSRPPRGSSASAKSASSRAEFPSKENAPTHRVIHGTLPCQKLKITKRLQVWREVFVPAQRDGQTAEESNCGVHLKMRSRRKSTRLYGTNSFRPTRRERLTWKTIQSAKNRERNHHSTHSFILMSTVLCFHI